LSFIRHGIIVIVLVFNQ